MYCVDIRSMSMDSIKEIKEMKKRNTSGQKKGAQNKREREEEKSQNVLFFHHYQYGDVGSENKRPKASTNKFSASFPSEQPVQSETDLNLNSEVITNSGQYHSGIGNYTFSQPIMRHQNSPFLIKIEDCHTYDENDGVEETLDLSGVVYTGDSSTTSTPTTPNPNPLSLSSTFKITQKTTTTTRKTTKKEVSTVSSSSSSSSSSSPSLPQGNASSSSEVENQTSVYKASSLSAMLDAMYDNPSNLEQFDVDRRFVKTEEIEEDEEEIEVRKLYEDLSGDSSEPETTKNEEIAPKHKPHHHHHHEKSPSSQVENDKRCCFNCQTLNTPLWRQMDGLKLCNACGLYYKIHGSHRPSQLNKRPPVKKWTKKSGEELVCTSCKTTSTPIWRRSSEGNLLCNACGLRSRSGKKSPSNSPTP